MGYPNKKCGECLKMHYKSQDPFEVMFSIFKNLNVQNILKCILQRLPVLGGVEVKIVA